VSPGAIRRFHVARDARARYDLGEPLFSSDGDLIVADPVAVRRLAVRMNGARAADERLGPPTVAAGEILAHGLIHEVYHALVERYEQDARPADLGDALAAAAAELDEPTARAALDAFADRFAVGGRSAAEPPGELLEELLLTRVANENPAAAPIRELFDDRPLAAVSRYPAVVAAIDDFLARQPGFGPEGETLLALLRAPARAAPTSLAGQLRWVREHWSSLVGDLLDRILLTLDD
jgi:hypothetical protein